MSIDEDVRSLNNILLDTAAASLKKITHSSHLKNNKRWYSKSCHITRSQLNSLAKQVCKDPKNNFLRGMFFTAKKKYKREIKTAKYTYKKQLMEKLELASESNPKEYWKLLEALKQTETSKTNSNSAISSEDWVTHFRNLFKPHLLTQSSTEKDILQELDKLEKEKCFNELSFRITIDEVQMASKQLKSGKSSGPDSLSNEIIKASLKLILPLITKLFNNILTSGSYPKCWTEGMITTLHKKGDLTCPDNYRGITISSCLGKLFCTVLNNRLKVFCNSNNLIDERQSGFRKKARTSDNVFIIKSLHEKFCLQDGKKLFACFIDFKKAFDSVWHDALLLKLLKVGIGGPFYNIIKSMYQNVTASVKNGNQLSDQFSIQRGVKQGDILSPLLFNIFMNDIVHLFDHDDTPLLLKSKVSCLMYADDLVIFSTSKNGLQNCLNRLNDYCNKWKLAINHSKSKIMCFSRLGKVSKEIFKLNGDALDEVQTYPYLGIEISNTGNFNSAQKSLKNKAQRALFKLKKLLYGSNLKPYVGLKLFDQLIKPICLYGSEIWGPKCISINETFDNDGCLERSLEKILCENLNMSFSKFLLGVHKKSQNSAVRGELGRLPIGTAVVTAICKYRQRLELLDKNTILREAYEVSNNTTSNKNKCWGQSTGRLTTFLKTHSNFDDAMLCNKKLLKGFLNSNYVKYWKDKIKGEQKMRTFSLFKHEFMYESYLNMGDERKRKALTRFRISAHQLAIERGRYTTPPTPSDKRLCKYCQSQTVEDEYHFLMNCSYYNLLRNSLKSNIGQKCKNFGILNEKNQFIFMLSAGNDVSFYVAEFVYDAFCKRNAGVIGDLQSS